MRNLIPAFIKQIMELRLQSLDIMFGSLGKHTKEANLSQYIVNERLELHKPEGKRPARRGEKTVEIDRSLSSPSSKQLSYFAA